MQLSIQFSRNKSVSIVWNQEGRFQAFICQKDAKAKVDLDRKIEEHILILARQNRTRKFLEQFLQSSIKFDFISGILSMRSIHLYGGGCASSKSKPKQDNPKAGDVETKVVEKQLKETHVAKEMLQKDHHQQFEVDDEFLRQYNELMDKCRDIDEKIKAILSIPSIFDNIRKETYEKAKAKFANVDYRNVDAYEEADKGFRAWLQEQKQKEELKNFINSLTQRMFHDYIEAKLQYKPENILDIMNEYIFDEVQGSHLENQIKNQLHTAGTLIKHFIVHNAEKFDPQKTPVFFILYKPYLLAILQELIDCFILLKGVESKANDYLNQIITTLETLQASYITTCEEFPSLDVIIYVEIFKGIKKIDEIVSEDKYKTLKQVGSLLFNVAKFIYSASSLNVGGVFECAKNILDSISEIKELGENLFEVGSGLLEAAENIKADIVGITESVRKPSNFFMNLVEIWTAKAQNEILKTSACTFHRRLGEVSPKSNQIQWEEIMFYFKSIQFQCLKDDQIKEQNNQVLNITNRPLLLCLLLKQDAILQILAIQIPNLIRGNFQMLDPSLEAILEKYLEFMYRLAEIDQDVGTKTGSTDLGNNKIVFMTFSILIRLWKILFYYEKKSQVIGKMTMRLWDKIAYGYLVANSKEIDPIFYSQDNPFKRKLHATVNGKASQDMLQQTGNQGNRKLKVIVDGCCIQSKALLISHLQS